MQQTAKSLVEKFNLLPHPEGGYYKELYRRRKQSLKPACPIDSRVRELLPLLFTSYSKQVISQLFTGLKAMNAGIFMLEIHYTFM